MKLPDDPFVIELLPEFIDTWLNDIQNQLPMIIESKNGDDLYRLAHTIKGSCFQFSLDHIAEMGIELMGYAKEMDWDNAHRMKELIEKSLIEVREELVEQGIITK